MVRAKEAWFERLGLIEWLTMTTLAQRRFDADRTVMVTALTHSVLTTMEVRRDLALTNVLHQPVYHLPMRELNRLVLICEEPNRHRVGYVSIVEREP